MDYEQAKIDLHGQNFRDYIDGRLSEEEYIKKCNNNPLNIISGYMKVQTEEFEKASKDLHNKYPELLGGKND